jgi:hypothetical protein
MVWPTLLILVGELDSSGLKAELSTDSNQSCAIFISEDEDEFISCMSVLKIHVEFDCS